MSNRKATFAKRQREMDLKDKARAKEAARAARQSQPKAGKGPQIDWSDPNYLQTQATLNSPDDADAPPPPPPPDEDRSETTDE